MGNKTTFVKKLMVGNLPASMVATAKVYDTAADTKDWKAADGCRLVSVAFKLTEKQIAKLADDSEIPSSFMVQVPSVDYTELMCDRAREFLTCLVQDYQDKMIGKVANKVSDIDPCNWSVVVSDYFDTTRGGLTAPTLREWIEEIFTEAYVLRQIDLNKTALAESRRVKTDAEVQGLVRGVQGYLRAVMPKDAIVGHDKLNTARRVLEKLIEVDMIAADDECAVWFLTRINALLQVSDETVAAEV